MTHGYPWISMDLHGEIDAYPSISIDIHAEVHGYPRGVQPDQVLWSCRAQLCQNRWFYVVFLFSRWRSFFFSCLGGIVNHQKITLGEVGATKDHFGWHSKFQWISTNKQITTNEMFKYFLYGVRRNSPQSMCSHSPVILQQSAYWKKPFVLLQIDRPSGRYANNCGSCDSGKSGDSGGKGDKGDSADSVTRVTLLARVAWVSG